MSKYPKDMRDYVRSIAHGRSSSEITRLVNEHYGYEVITVKNMIQYKKSYGIRSEYWYPVHEDERSKAHRFTTDRIPTNKKPVGSTRVDKDGYTLVKTAEPNKWEFAHKVIWKEAHGEIPKGYAITFLDGNKSNLDINNLAMVSFNENQILNKRHLRSDDPDITKTAITLSKLIIAKNEMEKNEQRI